MNKYRRLMIDVVEREVVCNHDVILCGFCLGDIENISNSKLDIESLSIEDLYKETMRYALETTIQRLQSKLGEYTDE